jgi:hypothetical protein
VLQSAHQTLFKLNLSLQQAAGPTFSSAVVPSHFVFQNTYYVHQEERETGAFVLRAQSQVGGWFPLLRTTQAVRNVHAAFPELMQKIKNNKKKTPAEPPL